MFMTFQLLQLYIHKHLMFLAADNLGRKNSKATSRMLIDTAAASNESS